MSIFNDSTKVNLGVLEHSNALNLSWFDDLQVQTSVKVVYGITLWQIINGDVVGHDANIVYGAGGNEAPRLTADNQNTANDQRMVPVAGVAKRVINALDFAQYNNAAIAIIRSHVDELLKSNIRSVVLAREMRTIVVHY